MVVNAPIVTNTEIFNTYGNTLSNAQLLVQYRFVIEGNDNDRVTFQESEIMHSLNGVIEAMELYTWKYPEIREDSVFSLQEDMLEAPEELLNHADTPGGLWIDGDGKISSTLWTLMVYRIRQRLPPSLLAIQSPMQLMGPCVIEFCDRRLQDLPGGNSDDIGELYDV